MRLTTAEIEEWSYTSTPPVCLRGLQRDSFLCYLRVTAVG